MNVLLRLLPANTALANEMRLEYDWRKQAGNVGYYRLEELIWSPDGRMYTTTLSAYKLPSHDHTPENWRVHLLKDAPSVKGLYQSKGTGELNLQLGMSVYLAAKDAIASARADEKQHGPFFLKTPATDDRVRAACPDRFH